MADCALVVLIWFHCNCIGKTDDAVTHLDDFMKAGKLSKSDNPTWSSNANFFPTYFQFAESLLGAEVFFNFVLLSCSFSQEAYTNIVTKHWLLKMSLLHWRPKSFALVNNSTPRSCRSANQLWLVVSIFYSVLLISSRGAISALAIVWVSWDRAWLNHVTQLFL